MAHTIARFAPSAIALSAVTFSLAMNGLYGWSYAPFAFGGFAVAASTLIFDAGKAVILPALANSFKIKSYIRAIIQILILIGLIGLSFYSSLTFFSQIIEGKQQKINQEIVRLQTETTTTQNRINYLVSHKYSNNGCKTPSNGVFTYAHCDLYSKAGKLQKDSIPYLVKLRATNKAEIDRLEAVTLFWGVKPVQTLTDLSKETIVLSLVLLMAALMEIFSTFGYSLLTSETKEKAAKIKPVKSEPALQTEEQSQAQLMAALKKHGMKQGKIAEAFGVNQSTVSRTLAAV